MKRIVAPFDKTNAAMGVDVSHHNGIVDWKAVRDAGAKFCVHSRGRWGLFTTSW